MRDSKYGTLGEGALPVVYLPLAQNHETGMTLYVRASVPPASLVAALRREIQAIEPNLPVPDIQTMTETIGDVALRRTDGRVAAGACSAASRCCWRRSASTACSSFSISRRTREMGIRLALGANAGACSCWSSATACGSSRLASRSAWPAAWPARVRSSSFLYGVSTWNVPTFVAVTAILAAVAFLACAIPARRAMRVSPIAALRYD